MNPSIIFYPCFALFLLTFLVLLRMFFVRADGIKSGAVRMSYFKTYDTGANHPAKMVQTSRNFVNLFEMPVLFYMVCIFSFITNNVSYLFLTLAWIYVAFRYIHSFIHLTSNHVLARMLAYTVSCIALFIMGVNLLLHIS